MSMPFSLSFSMSDFKEKPLFSHCSMERKKISETCHMCFDSFLNIKYQAGCVEGEMPGIAVKLYKTYAQLSSPLFLRLPHLHSGKDPTPNSFSSASSARTGRCWHLTHGSRKKRGIRACRTSDTSSQQQ